MNQVVSHAHRSLRPGFSLFELVIVFGLIAMISGIGAFYLSAPRVEEEIRREHLKVEDFVREARTLASSYQQPFVVRLKEGVVQLEPQARPELGISHEGDDIEDVEEQSSGLKDLTSEGWPREEQISEEYLMELRRWGSHDFIAITDRAVEVIVFSPDGLSEPVAVRLSRDEGDNSITRNYHPLTGLAEDEEVLITGN